MPVPNINIGGPCLASDGTLVVAGIGTSMLAYRTPSPWTQLGGGIAGTRGLPTLTGTGSLTAGNTVTFALADGLPNSFGVFVLGFSAVSLPAFGGTLVPSPDLLIDFALDGAGRWSLQGPWPTGLASGTTLHWQAGFVDPAAPFGIAASDALRSIAP